MSNIRSGLFDRIDESFKVFRKSFLKLSLPILLYKLFSIAFLGNIFILLFFNIVDFKSILFGTYDQILTNFLTNRDFIIFVCFSLILFVLYLFFIIPFYLGTLKSIKQAYSKDEITPKENLIYGFKNIINSFKIYWYIFKYVALLPALIFIFGGIIFNIGFYFDEFSFLKYLGIVLILVGTILFIVLSIYRGVKTNFAFSRSIDKDSYLKHDFYYSIKITKGSWLRIFGNLLFLGIVISSIGSIVGGFVDSISVFLNYGEFSSLNEGEELAYFIEYFSNFNLFNFFTSVLDVIIKTSLNVFFYVFIYVFYKHLDNENLGFSKNDSKKIEL